MINILVLLCLGYQTAAAKQPPLHAAPNAKHQASTLGGVEIGKGKLSELLVRFGPGRSVVRPSSPFNDGWTFWRVRGTRNEFVTAYWEPATPKSSRVVTRFTIDSFSSVSHTPSVKPSQLGFWASIRLGVRPAALVKQLKALGSPTVESNTLTWRGQGIIVTAHFPHGRLDSVDVGELLLH